ncbi:MNIO family bufferin maturase [Shewanella frigidimarina]|uniref:MNIO family bufferin maturase n=1 Tax=Shewanella frigidimarina TaxID=56812 RepID=UPI003D7AFC99
MPDTRITEDFLGFGLGLRTDHFEYILQHQPDIDWFEVLSENYLVAGGKPRYYLEAIAEQYPVVMHGVSMSIGSSDPLDMDYLKALKKLSNDIQPKWISDHICWTSIHGVNSHDLLPLPYTEETVKHVAERVRIVQDFLGRRILLENVSSYLSYQDSTMDEWDFLSQVAEAADCLVLLDINNIYVSARNHHFNPLDYLKKIDPRRVQQFHLAGHSDFGDYVIDTHDHDVPPSVWTLYQAALERFGAVSTMIERDANIPEFPALYNELLEAKHIAQLTLPDDPALARSQFGTRSLDDLSKLISTNHASSQKVRA